MLIYTNTYLRHHDTLQVTSGDVLTNNFYLERSSILNKMHQLLGVSNAINTVALVGIGGSGKTTLAQQYANSHGTSIVWKINAETAESTFTSLECLAYALCENEADKADFYEIQKITNLFKKEYMTFSFLKRKAPHFKDWILIYDNVTNFSDIQKYLPRTLQDWGGGKQIKKKTRLFLENIPPFPLDITQAAYYIKNTGTEYAKYLQYIANEDQNFANTQKSILEAITNYTKTRNLDKLLLLSSILNAENIPKDLLIACCGDIASHNFINEMQKFSLITEDDNNLGNVMSIHASIQSIIFHYVHKIISTEYYDTIIPALVNYMDSELALNKDRKKQQLLYLDIAFS
ncbi:unnamed protein product [Rotaria magnacalcarata]|uniref:NB-ARC domain-containing protein n=1 Tax=Rotaria magnacalcarata TaxID=392030 RepID=A0A819B5H0_9BILA|nr:unnamed protein product [Rotaria magnacalcarata]